MASPFNVVLPSVGQIPWSLNPAIQEIRQRLAVAEDLATTLDANKYRTTTVKTPLEFGAAADGVTDDTTAVQNTFNSLGSKGGTVILGTHKLSSNIVLNTPNIIVYGGNLIGGGFFIGSETADPADLDITLDGTIIAFPEITTGKHGITLIGARRVNVRGVKIFRADHSVHIGVRGWQQHTRRVVFDSTCVFHQGNAGIYADQYNPSGVPNPQHYGIGDFHVIGMQFSDLQNSIKMAGVDGILIDSITSFQRQSATRQRAIDLDYVTWTKISNSNLFESGNESIRLSRFQQTQVMGNAIAWPGQLTPSSGILMQGGDTDGFSNSNSQIVNNLIQWPTKHGIEQASGVDSISIVGNRIIEAGSTAKYRDATDTLADRQAAMAAFEHFGVVTPAAIRTIANSNVVTGTDPNTNDGTRFSFGHTGAQEGNQDARGVVTHFAKGITITGTTIDAARGYERASCNHSTATTVSTITKPTDSGAILRITAFTANTTILHSSGSVVLKNNVSAAMPQNGVLTLQCVSNVWREVSRSW